MWQALKRVSVKPVEAGIMSEETPHPHATRCESLPPSQRAWAKCSWSVGLTQERTKGINQCLWWSPKSVQ